MRRAIEPGYGKWTFPGGYVDWGALAAAPGPLILHATATHLPDAARTLNKPVPSARTIAALLKIEGR